MGEGLERFQGDDRTSEARGVLTKPTWLRTTANLLHVSQDARREAVEKPEMPRGKASYSKEGKP